MPSASSRILTQIAVSISYDNNHYTTDTFLKIFLFDKTMGKANKKKPN